MVHNEILITLNLYYKMVSTRHGGSYYIACGEGFDEPACTHNLGPRQSFRFLHPQRIKVEEHFRQRLDNQSLWAIIGGFCGDMR